MIKTTDLTQDEIEFLLSKYDNDIQVIQSDIDILLNKQAFLMKRKAALTGRDDLEYNAIIPPIVITQKPIQKDVFGNDNLSSFNTVRKKIGYIFNHFPGQYSTGEMYNKLIEVFPSEGEKKKPTYVQGLSKELGQTPKLYKKNDNNKDANGKGRFAYVGK